MNSVKEKNFIFNSRKGSYPMAFVSGRRVVVDNMLILRERRLRD